MNGDRPLTFLTHAHLEYAANTLEGVVIAEPCGCGGGWITYRAAYAAAVPSWAVVVVSHSEAVAWAPQAGHGVPKEIRALVAERAARV
jgi:hypothetical protein